MNKFTELLSSIDFEFWRNLNPYFSDENLSASMTVGLKLIQDAGFLRDLHPSSGTEFVSSIKRAIQKFDEGEPDYELLAEIFDMIQAWGGRMGRHPYVISRSRYDFDIWKSDYLDGAVAASSDRPVDALKFWTSIKGLGMSFAPKHLRFWNDSYPVLDTRMSLILTGSKTRLLSGPERYREFLELISCLSEKFSSTNVEAEKALFAFSQKFFKNDSLDLKGSDLENEKDIQIARSLQMLQKRAVQQGRGTSGTTKPLVA